MYESQGIYTDVTMSTAVVLEDRRAQIIRTCKKRLLVYQVYDVGTELYWHTIYLKQLHVLLSDAEELHVLLSEELHVLLCPRAPSC